ncbi:hypothetical protein K435DRAFT_867012 [Dendrothele bispora CBS 962.96]|uniref:Uncharacterized protein n=1 Tax=Dendrothele bispora (strain CBS 962.96) TaxID=1314807 RepID=A0A4V4HDL9_DENBC|nr:hypothetical protein K435DRAFT_867012 [Dendrothele bispora CBS 962.96]
MVNNHCTHVVYYTINRVLYILYHDEEGVPAPVRSFGCPSADSNKEAVDKDNTPATPIDYVQYISWLLEAHEGRTADWQALSEELHRQHVEKKDKDKDTSNTMIRMALKFPFPVFGGISLNIEELFYKDFPVHSSSLSQALKGLQPYIPFQYSRSSVIWADYGKNLTTNASILPGHVPKVLMISRGLSNLVLQKYSEHALEEWSDLNSMQL